MDIYANPLEPVFEQKRIIASGMAHGSVGTYTSDMFLADFPQFGDSEGTSHVPSTQLDLFVSMANDAVLPDAWGRSYRYAAGLYVAHFAAMYLSTYVDGTPSGSIAAGAAENVGIVKSATMGDTSVSYDNSAVTAGTEKWGTWNSTKYGAQLITMARTIGIAGSFIV